MNIGYLYPPGYVYAPLPRVQFVAESADAGTGEYAVLTWAVGQGRGWLVG